MLHLLLYPLSLRFVFFYGPSFFVIFFFCDLWYLQITLDWF